MSARARRSRGGRDAHRRAPSSSAAALTLVHVAIDTGRTHQIRVHLSAIGHPIVGDALYGGVTAPRAGRSASGDAPRASVPARRATGVHASGRRTADGVRRARCPTDLQRVLDDLRAAETSEGAGAQQGRVTGVRDGHRLHGSRVLGRGRTGPFSERHRTRGRHRAPRPSVVLIPMPGRRPHRAGPAIPASIAARHGSCQPGAWIRANRRAAAARECEEEIGLVPGLERLRVVSGAGILRRRADLFPGLRFAAAPAGLAARAGRGRRHPGRRLTVAEAKAMVARGEIVDLKTAYGLTLIWASRGSRFNAGLKGRATGRSVAAGAGLTSTLRVCSFTGASRRRHQRQREHLVDAVTRWTVNPSEAPASDPR